MNAVIQEAQQANQLGDNLLAEDLQQQYTDLQEQLSRYEKDFVTTNTDSYISALILERFLNQKTMPKNEVKEVLRPTLNEFAAVNLGSIFQISSMRQSIQLQSVKLLLCLTGQHLPETVSLLKAYAEK